MSKTQTVSLKDEVLAARQRTGLALSDAKIAYTKAPTGEIASVVECLEQAMTRLNVAARELGVE